jgi:hypothetical protein
VRQINRASEEEGDDELMRKKMIHHQNEVNQKMAKRLLNILVLFGFLFLFLYLYECAGNGKNENQSALAKSLGILLGLRKRENPTLPKTKIVVSFIPFMRTELEQYSYPSWSWPFSTNDPQYLVPDSGKGSKIKTILHRVAQLKKINNLHVELHDPNDVESFLSGEYGQICSKVLQGSEHRNIFKQYQSFGYHGAKSAQKLLWMWCLLYTDQAHGFLDLDLYNIQLGYGLISSLTNHQIQNLIVDPSSIEIKNDEKVLPSFVTSSLFLMDATSNVPQGMLRYFLESDANSISQSFMMDSILHMKELIMAENDKWVLPKANCVDQNHYFPLADICYNSTCCQLIRPRNNS